MPSSLVLTAPKRVVTIAPRTAYEDDWLKLSNVLLSPPPPSYSPVGVLGLGATGCVYAAETACGRMVAIKRVVKKALPSYQAYQAVQREMKIGKMMLGESRHLVDVWMTKETTNTFLMVMRKVEGMDLGQRIRDEGKIANQRALAIVEDVLKGLKVLHEKGVVHRDLKLENIVEGKDGAVIVDYGCAVKMNDKGWRKEMVGTKYARAPEMNKGNMYGKEVDLWGVGVVLWALINGTVPKRGQMVNNGKDDEGKVGRLLQGLLEKNPDKRMNIDVALKVVRGRDNAEERLKRAVSVVRVMCRCVALWREASRGEEGEWG